MGLLLPPISQLSSYHTREDLTRDEQDHVFRILKLASLQSEKSAFFSDQVLAEEITEVTAHLPLIREQISEYRDRLAELTECERRLEDTRVVLVELEKLPSRTPPPLPTDIAQAIVQMTAETSIASAKRMTLVSEMFQHW